jgi:hypothetical protein
MKSASATRPSGSGSIVATVLGIALFVGCEASPAPSEDQGATHSALSKPRRGPGSPVPRPLPEAGTPSDAEPSSDPAAGPAAPQSCFDECISGDHACVALLDDCESSCDDATGDECVVDCVTEARPDCADFFDACDAQCSGGGDD